MLSLSYSGLLEAGTDEAGRGCLAGPVTAAAVILPPDFQPPKLNDSKKLSALLRSELRQLVESNAIAFAVSHVQPGLIDELNILKASILAMHQALEQLAVVPEFIAVDGNRFTRYKEVPHQCVIKGDGRFLNIAAASVLAKTYRDELMMKLHEKYPQYNWIRNKGYPTAEHREAIRKYGSCLQHRRSFRLLPRQLELDF